MFEYKDASFFTSYFENHPDFKLINEFKESEVKGENGLFVGYVEVLNTIHPLEIRVEIPKTFPHQKLMFRTKSLYGYPHLIPTGKTEYGCWFCLNTPFAETPENQLEQDIFRLKEWIRQYMRHDLPAIIQEKDTRDALAFANAYDWENLDILNEYHKDAVLTFVGDFAKDAKYFNEETGHFHCVKSPSGRFFVTQSKDGANFELPYIIVSEAPKNNETFNDFVLLREQYDWDDNVCKHLLPDFKLSTKWSVELSSAYETLSLDADEALKIIEETKVLISTNDLYTPLFKFKEHTLLSCLNKPQKVLPQQRELLLSELNRLREQVVKDNGYKCKSIWEDEDDYDGPDPEYYLQLLAHFAFGVKKGKQIEWYLISTNKNAIKSDTSQFNISLCVVQLYKVLSQQLCVNNVQFIGYDQYFGRGCFSHNLQGKRIALVGLGAIGSMVGESLARSGVAVVGLWDGDVVEPGNICRSTYQINDLGNSKVRALGEKIRTINPFVDIKVMHESGYWTFGTNYRRYEDGSFYGNVNYKNQEESIQEIENYDLIIDCTGSNEMLHFLSYAVPKVQIISLCITNHANDLLCVTSRDGNPFELRKAYLSRIEQDTKNYFLEGSGCYSPTFLATNSDIASLVNLFLRNLNQEMLKNELLHSAIWSHCERGVIADYIESYKLDGYNIKMTISSETIYDGEEMADTRNGLIGYLLGAYSKDGKMIMVTHIVESDDAESKLIDAFSTSKGIIDYIGDYAYSTSLPNTYSQESMELIARKAADESINTCNPMLAVRNPNGSLSFFLYINQEMVPFVKEN